MLRLLVFELGSCLLARSCRIERLRRGDSLHRRSNKSPARRLIFPCLLPRIVLFLHHLYPVSHLRIGDGGRGRRATPRAPRLTAASRPGVKRRWFRRRSAWECSRFEYAALPHGCQIRFSRWWGCGRISGPRSGTWGARRKRESDAEDYACCHEGARSSIDHKGFCCGLTREITSLSKTWEDPISQRRDLGHPIILG